MKSEQRIKEVLSKIEDMRKSQDANVDQFGAHCLSDTNKTNDGRFRYLIGLLLSSQTPDPVTAQAIYRLDTYLPVGDVKQLPTEEILKKQLKFTDISTHKLTFENVRKSDVAALAQLIKPVSFYNTKAKNLKTIAETNSDVPNTFDELIKLNGIGPKMANLAMDICYDEQIGIAVDTHMRRICQKLGFAGDKNCTASPEQVERELEECVPKEHWKRLNQLIVGFGQTVCSAVKPKCYQCQVYSECLWPDRVRMKKMEKK